MAQAYKTRGLILLAGSMLSAGTSAYVVNINPGTRAVYLRVGDGVMTGGNYSSGGTPGTGAGVNIVSVTVPAAAVGNGIDQVMAGNGRLTSDWDGFTFCNAGQIYIGGFFRLPSGASVQNATLSVTAPAVLTNASGETMPISQISWTSSGIGDTGAQPVPAGTFSGGNQTLAVNFLRNTWRESCHTFSYGNDAIVGAGTYTATVTYTLSAP